MQPVNAIPEGRAYHASASSRCHMYIFGGVANQRPKSPRVEMARIRYFDQLWRYAYPTSNASDEAGCPGRGP